MIQRYKHVLKAWCDGSENDRLIIELAPKLKEEQKKAFSERIKS
jgi:hypothetical protein